MNYIKNSNPKRYIIVDKFNSKLIGIYSNKDVAKIVLKSLGVADEGYHQYEIRGDNRDVNFEQLSEELSKDKVTYKISRKRSSTLEDKANRAFFSWKIGRPL